MHEKAFSKFVRLQRLAIVLTALGLAYIAGYRPFGLGLDFENYEKFFYGLTNYQVYQDSVFEYGFKLLSEFFQLFIKDDYSIFVLSLVFLSLLYKLNLFIDNKHAILTVAFYVLVWFPVHENTQLRAAIALAFMFAAAHNMFEGRWGWFMALSAAATAFHISSPIVALALVGASRLAKYELWKAAAILFAFAAAAALLLSYFDILDYIIQMFRKHFEYDNQRSMRPNPFSGTNILTGCFLFCFALSGSADDTRSKTYFLMTVGGFAAFLLLFQVPVMAQRFKDVFFVFMTFIAFNYRLSTSTFPQFALATTLAFWSIYSSVNDGLFGG